MEPNISTYFTVRRNDSSVQRVENIQVGDIITGIIQPFEIPAEHTSIGESLVVYDLDNNPKKGYIDKTGLVNSLALTLEANCSACPLATYCRAKHPEGTVVLVKRHKVPVTLGLTCGDNLRNRVEPLPQANI